MHLPGADDIICLETVGDNEVMDYFLTQPLKKIASVKENILLRPVYSIRS